jgi:hypothetical protein
MHLMRKKLMEFAILLSVSIAGPAFGADDGFKAFWARFTAAMVKGDVKATAEMVKFPQPIGTPDITAANFADRWKEFLPPEVRKCLAKAKPVADKDADGKPYYAATCDDEYYVFSKTGDRWLLSDTGPND